MARKVDDVYLSVVYNRYKLQLIGVCLILVGGFVFFSTMSQQLDDAYAINKYKSYLCTDFIPNNRKTSQKWPVNLHRLSTYVANDHANNGEISAFFQKHRTSIHIVKQAAHEAEYVILIDSKKESCVVSLD